jgi:hypothetical protein
MQGDNSEHSGEDASSSANESATEELENFLI